MHDSQLGFHERDLCYWTRGGCRGESKLVVEALEDEQLLDEAPEWEGQEFLQAWIAELDARSSSSPTALAHAVSRSGLSGGGDRAQGDQGGHGKEAAIDSRRVADKQHAYESALPLATGSFEEPFTLPAHVPTLPLRDQAASIEYPANALSTGHQECQQLEFEGQRAGIGSVKAGVGWGIAAGPVTAFEAAFKAAVSSIVSSTAADPNVTESTAVKEVCAADSAWQSFDIVDSAAARSSDSTSILLLASAVGQEAGNFVGTCKWKPSKVFCIPPVSHSTPFQNHLSIMIFLSVNLSFCIFS
jgi:hypothetical protein